MLKIRVVKAMLRVTAATAISLLAAFSASAQTIRYVHTDGLGSVVLMTDKDRNVVERSEYEPYGSLLNRALTDGPGYTGHITDATTGLVYMQQRYYDAGVGRFLSNDPIAVDGNTGAAFNRYGYGANNPYKFVDLDGRAPTSEILYGPGGRGGDVSAAEEINENLKNDGTRKFKKGTELERVNAALYVINKVREKVESTGNISVEAAARYFMRVFQPVSTQFGVELAANIINKNSASDTDVRGLWYLRDIDVGRKFYGDTGIGFMAPANNMIPGGYNIHSHPLEDNGRGWNSPFSTGDIESYRWQRSTGYLSTPSMRLYRTNSGGPVEEVK